MNQAVAHERLARHQCVATVANLAVTCALRFSASTFTLYHNYASTLSRLSSSINHHERCWPPVQKGQA